MTLRTTQEVFFSQSSLLGGSKSTCLSVFQHLGLLQGNSLPWVNNLFNIIKKDLCCEINRQII